MEDQVKADPAPRSSAGDDAIGCIVAFLIVGGIITLTVLGGRQVWKEYGPGAKADAAPAEDQRIVALQAQVKVLSERMIESERESARVAAEAQALTSLQSTSATFAPGQSGYAPVTTPSGRFLVMLEDVKPYADGQRLTLRVGNLQFATYSRPKIKLKWGRRFSSTLGPKQMSVREVRELRYLGVVGQGGREYSASDETAAAQAAAAEEAAHYTWRASLSTKEEQLLVDLRPGSWTTFSITVAPATSQDVGFIEFTMDASVVSMAGR
ncbi:DUF3251 domain-containing protein [Corallococcus silvisoli]|uniref:DUF3251 domain-containing protein n=1 Tax=Corallococcus silvisoli TaxID=2697031 RepID=UPI0013776B6A|nr:DUF3251 domain-containing protein [Corallococcus silvisoli]NBD11836.1 DUF3251 domain-containing protein [Corallococcus silvisoli]